MKPTKAHGRLVGVLFLLIFAIGIAVFQFLQGPVLFSDDFLTLTAVHSNDIILSILLSFLSGILSICSAILLFPIFKKYSYPLALLYLIFTVLNFITLSIDNFSVVGMLEVSLAHIQNSTDTTDMFHILGQVSYKKHWWTHYLSLLISCFPVFTLYYTFYISKLVPRIISIVGLVATILMFTEILSSILGHSISMNMLIPIGLIQFILPLWLIIKDLNLEALEVDKKS